MKIKYSHKVILDYPSGSALEFYNDMLLVVGDDVNHILCLDKDWKESTTIKLFDFDGVRIPKPEKPDLECATIINDMMYVIGSGSKSPQRDVAFIVDLSDNKIKKISTASFYAIFRDRNLVAEMNIEGFTDCKDKLLFFNRGNTQQPNQLIITDQKILKKQFPDKFKVMPVNIGTLNQIALGISGACYDEQNDVLFLTASAEDTNNAYDDGEIIGSTLAVVYNAYQKLDNQSLEIDVLIELDTIDNDFHKQKIESICITKQNDKDYTCALVADNDDGKSVLFEITIEI